MWTVENRSGIWRVVNGQKVWGCNQPCTKYEALRVADALNSVEVGLAENTKTV